MSWLGMGLGLMGNVAATSGGGGGAWTPASIAGGVNMWTESDPTKLYTNAGTTPVSADGDPVQQANDKSVTGRNVSQATLANRPLYKVGPKPYLLFDATNDTMAGSGTASWTDGSGQLWIAFAASLSNVTNNQHIMLIRENAGNQQIRLYVTTGKLFGFSSYASATAGLTVSINTPFVGIAQLTTSNLSVYLNNGTADSVASSALATTAAQVWLGSSIGASNFMGANGYAFISGPGVLSSGDRASLNTYMTALYT